MKHSLLTFALCVFAMLFVGNAHAQWSTNPYTNNAISTAANDQYSPTIVSDGAGGAIITWNDYRSGTNVDIYAQWTNANASNFQILAKILPITDIPNDQGGKVRIKWQRSAHDIIEASGYQLTFYGVWRKIPAGYSTSKIVNMQTLVMDDTLGLLYDFITSVPAVQSPAYNVVAPTLDDSSAAGTHYFTFLITAHTSDPRVFFISQPDSGYSGVYPVLWTES